MHLLWLDILSGFPANFNFALLTLLAQLISTAATENVVNSIEERISCESCVFQVERCNCHCITMSNIYICLACLYLPDQQDTFFDKMPSFCAVPDCKNVQKFICEVLFYIINLQKVENYCQYRLPDAERSID